MKPNRERGSILLLTAILIPAMIMIVALASDLAVLYAVRNKAQNTADAAALAGAYACKLDNGACLINTDAQTAANQASQANPILGQVVTPTSVTTFQCTDGAGHVNYCVTVVLNATSPVFFSRMFNWAAVSFTGVRATAQTNTGFGSGYTEDCLKPIFIPDVATNFMPPGSTTCQSPSPAPNLDPKKTPYLAAGSTLCSIRPTDPSGALVPSNFYSLDYSSLLAPASDPNAVEPVAFADGTFDTDGGAHVYRDSWSKCMVNVLTCGTKVRVQTGVSVGPTNQGAQTMIGQSFYAPVWDAAQQVKIGNNFYATVTGFAYFSNLKCVGGGPSGACGPSSKIQATFQKYIDCTTTTGLGVSTGSYEEPVRLVNPNLTSLD